MTTTYAVHEDYRKVPSYDFKYGRLMIWALNAYTRWDRRKCAVPRAGTTREAVQIPGAGGASIPALLIRPAVLPPGAPILLYFHGGAFVFTYGTLHVRLCEQYALEAGCIVVLVDYRLAPQHPFPAGFDDCYAALAWARVQAAQLGGDAQRIAVGGDSAGGALAAGVAQKALDQGVPLRAQLLVYPVLDSECKTQSAREFVRAPLFNAPSNRRMWPAYLGHVGPAPEYAAPGLRKNLRGLPPCYIDTAEFDPLRDEGNAYAQALAEQGVAVTHHATRGTIHGYELVGRNPETRRSLKQRVEFLKAHL